MSAPDTTVSSPLTPLDFTPYEDISVKDAVIALLHVFQKHPDKRLMSTVQLLSDLNAKVERGRRIEDAARTYRKAVANFCDEVQMEDFRMFRPLTCKTYDALRVAHKQLSDVLPWEDSR